VDDWKARMWAQVLPKVRIHEDIQLRTSTGWAGPSERTAPGSLPSWRSSMLSTRNTGRDPEAPAPVHGKHQALKNASTAQDQRRPGELFVHFQKYGSQYGFDPLMLAAQGYQESTLNQDAKRRRRRHRSHAVMPATGEELKVGDIEKRDAEHPTRREVHGPAHDQVLQGRESSTSRTGHCSPSRATTRGRETSQKMRKEAARRGLDPISGFKQRGDRHRREDRPRDNDLRAHIFKYYVAYKLGSQRGRPPRR